MCPIELKYGESFSATGIFTAALYRAHDLDVVRFDVLAAHRRIGRDEMNVELERRRAGLFEPRGIIDPTFGGHRVEARDHRDIDRVDRAPQGIEVARHAAVVIGQLRKVAPGFRLAVGAVFGVHGVGGVLRPNLLLEE